MYNEASVINQLFAQKSERGSFVNSLCDEFGSSLSLKNIEDILISAVVCACNENTGSLKREVKSLPLTASNEEIDEAMELYTCVIDNQMWSLFSDDEIAKKRWDSVLNDPSIIGYDNFSFEGFHHIGFNYGLYWYAITGLQPDISICVNLNHYHANLIKETLEAVFSSSQKSQQIDINEGHNTRAVKNSTNSFFVFCAIASVLLVSVVLILLATR